jgi:hypothetical protein
MKFAVLISFIVALLFSAPCLFSHVANASPFISLLSAARECPARGENAGTSISISRIGKSHTLIITVDHDD